LACWFGHFHTIVIEFPYSLFQLLSQLLPSLWRSIYLTSQRNCIGFDQAKKPCKRYAIDPLRGLILDPLYLLFLLGFPISVWLSVEIQSDEFGRCPGHRIWLVRAPAVAHVFDTVYRSNVATTAFTVTSGISLSSSESLPIRVRLPANYDPWTS